MPPHAGSTERPRVRLAIRRTEENPSGLMDRQKIDKGFSSHVGLLTDPLSLSLGVHKRARSRSNLERMKNEANIHVVESALLQIAT